MMNESRSDASLSNNQQSIVPKRFAELKEKKKKDIENLINLFTNKSALALLPMKMWIYIVSFVLPNDYDAYFIFLRKNICYQDTYYMFIEKYKYTYINKMMYKIYIYIIDLTY